MPVPSQRLALAIAASAAQAVASAQPSEASEAATPIGAQVVAGLQAAPLLPRITVSAKGYRAADLDTPASAVIVGREQILDRGAANVGDALRGEPGLAVASDGAQGANPVIRGLKRESIVLQVDGMRLNSAQPAGAVASFMSLGLAERVEVIKGPASVLYGTGALGGVIDVQLPQAELGSGTEGRAQLLADSASRGWRGAGVVRMGNDQVAAMAGVAALHADDYEAPGGRVDRTGYDSLSAIGQLRVRLGAGQTLRASLQSHQDDDVAYPGSTRPHPSPAVGTTTVYSPEQRRELAELGWNLSADGATPWSLDARLYRQQVARQIFSRGNALGGAPGRDIAQTRVRFDTDGLGLRAQWRPHPAHQLAAGVDAWRMEASPTRLVGQPPSFALMPNNPFDDGRIEALGAFVQDDMVAGDWRVLAGLRADRVRGRAASIANGTVTDGLARSDSAVSGQLGVVWEAAPGLRPYANLARGFRAGEMRERFEASPRADGFYYVGNPQIRPETATQLELGVKGERLGLQYQLAAYVNRIDDYITGRDVSGAPGSNRCPPAFTATCKETVNLGQATIRGIEGWLRWQAAPGHWLTAAASALRGTNEDLDEPLFQMPADEISIGWEGTIAPGWRADATLRAVRRQDRVAAVFARGTENPTAGFATADLGVVWQATSRHRLRVALKNLADKAYHEHLADGVSGQETPAPGRSLQVSWSGSF
ncbi:MAG: TonB-dependent receptor [Burkholderiaceae bacterium]|nr:TonB-dependent receptor [Burkholderiaceae bacterium]